MTVKATTCNFFLCMDPSSLRGRKTAHVENVFTKFMTHPIPGILLVNYKCCLG